ncbi:MAG: sigma-70 family RNA polymerase sigma factor [Planctomycetaceae bacterium]
MNHDERNPQHRTRGTLLARVRDITDAEAWREFVADYGPLILKWCEKHGLQPADSEDVVQDVLARLVSAMRTFDYNPGRGRFRGWLKTVTQNAVIDFVKSRQRPGEGSGDSAIGRILDACESGDTVEELSRAFEQQAEIELLREAEARVKLRVKPANWDAWRLSMHENMKAAEIARRLEIEVTDVYVARSRVSKMLKEEVTRIEGLTLESFGN